MSANSVTDPVVNSEPLGPQPAPQLPEKLSFRVNNRQLHDLAKDCMFALEAANDPVELYLCDGNIVRCRASNDNVSIVLLGREVLDFHLSQAADFYKADENSRTPAFIPKRIVSDLLKNAENMKLPELKGVTRVPAIRSDGSILDTEGYDTETKLYYKPRLGFRMPAKSDKPDIDWITILLAQFPFIDRASKANMIALLLAVHIRHLVRTMPLFMVTAPEKGTGKTYLTEAVAITATGEYANLSSLPYQDDELRKVLSTAFAAGERLIIFDNVSVKVQSHELSKALTCSRWKDRRLGVNESIIAPNNAVFVANGNNLEVGGDMARRCIWIKLDAKVANPSMRTGFEIDNFLNFCKDNMGDLLGAVLGMISSWFKAGKPKAPATPTVGSFEEATEMLAGILHFHSIKGFLENYVSLSVSTEDLEAEGFVRQFKVFGIDEKATTDRTEQTREFYCREAIDKASDVLNTGLAAITLPETVRGKFREKPAQAVALGRYLGKIVDRRFGKDNIHIAKGTLDRDTTQLWLVRWNRG